MPIQFPKPKITTEQWDKFLKNPEVVTLEVLFVIVTVGNLFILYRILLDVCPFPIAVTWFQLFIAFLFAFVLGSASGEFPRCAFFPPFYIDWKLYQSLIMPTIVYLGMITFANILLNIIPSIASFPTAVSLAVVLHHISRFIGCGQMYLPIRWLSVFLILIGFLIGCIDVDTVGLAALPIALCYGFFSSTFRAWCLEKAMHVVEGKGNTLHNHQVVLGLFLLPVFAFLRKEYELFNYMPTDFSKFFTWQYWGVLVIAGTAPFVKNVIANRMIRKTGQAPWRILEAISMVFVFFIGGGIWDKLTFLGAAAFTFVLSGRILGTLDALSKDPEDRRRAMRKEAEHSAEIPSPSGRLGAVYSLVPREPAGGAVSGGCSSTISAYSTTYESINDDDTSISSTGLSDSLIRVSPNPLSFPVHSGLSSGTEKASSELFGCPLTFPLSGYNNEDDDDDNDRLIAVGEPKERGARSFSSEFEEAIEMRHKQHSNQYHKQQLHRMSANIGLNSKLYVMDSIKEEVRNE